MRVARSRTGRLARSLRGFGARFALAISAILALALFIFSQVSPAPLERLRSAADGVLAPIIYVVNLPVRVVEDVVIWGQDVAFLYRENIRLREENQRLMDWQLAAQRLATENNRLKALLEVNDMQATPVATARIIGQSAGNYVRTVLINAGQIAGVAPGHVAADRTGVLGRVITVSPTTARVLLLTDLNSRIPVKVLPADVNAILAGDNLDQPALTFLPAGSQIAAGDWVVTTSHGGIFPPDMPVGRVALTPKGGKPRVMLSADLTRLDYVRILAFTPATPPPAAAGIPTTPEAPQPSP